MKNTIKKCKICNGSGLVKSLKMDARDAIIECSTCKGTGVVIFDEEYDSALPYMDEDLDHEIDED